MKQYLLWDRFLSYWLPPDKATGDMVSDINEGLRTTYRLPNGNGAVFAQKAGLSTIIVTDARTNVASKIPPFGGIPEWMEWRDSPSAKEQRALLNDTIRDFIESPKPHVILRTGRVPFTFEQIVLGGGTVVIVNQPGYRVVTDAIRVGRARRALKVLGTARRARDAQRLIRLRSNATGDTGGIDSQIQRLIVALKVTPTQFFDAMDLLEGVTPYELELAGQGI